MKLEDLVDLKTIHISQKEIPRPDGLQVGYGESSLTIKHIPSGISVTARGPAGDHRMFRSSCDELAQKLIAYGVVQ